MLRSKIVKRALQQGFSGRSRWLLHNLGLSTQHFMNLFPKLTEIALKRLFSSFSKIEGIKRYGGLQPAAVSWRRGRHDRMVGTL
jgi:hypothetical protein